MSDPHSDAHVYVVVMITKLTTNTWLNISPMVEEQRLIVESSY